MQPVTYSYKRGYRLINRRGGGNSLYWKRKAHKRARGATRKYLAHQDWDRVLEARPVTDWDVC